MFIVPAVNPKTRRLVYKLIVPAIGLAVVGILFAHFVVIPVVIRGTTLFTELDRNGNVRHQLDAQSRAVALSCVRVDLPIADDPDHAGTHRPRQLEITAHLRRYAIMGSLLAGGIAAPDGQPTTMMLMAAPLYVLYEASIWIIILLERSWQRESAV